MFGLIFANCFMMKYEKRVNQSTAESQQIEAYLKLLQTYAETGQCLSVENSYSLVSLKALTDEETLFSFSYSHEALLVYLQQIMTDDFVRSRVADNQILQRVFVDTMIQFVTQNLQKAQYQLQRTRAEINALCEAYEWSIVDVNKDGKICCFKLKTNIAGKVLTPHFTDMNSSSIPSMSKRLCGAIFLKSGIIRLN